MFIEGKWFYNNIVSNLQNKDFSLKEFNPLISEIKHFDKDKNEIISQLNYLPGSYKQTILSQIISSLKTIKTLKKRKFQKHGNLKFISELSAINLKQYGITHEIRSSTKMKIQGISKLVKVSGIQQIKKLKNIDFANAKLLNKASGYYIVLNCYVPILKTNKNKQIIHQNLGLDFGCKTSITDSNGKKINISFEESEQLKKLQRQLSKKKNKYSNRRNKLIKKIRKEYEHISNKKRDISNKFIHQMKSYDKVIIQDEQLQNWQKNGHGKKIQHSCLGKIKTKLKQLDNVVVLDKFIPTTKMCIKCGKIHNMKQSQRIFNCDCGINEDRDVHAAQNMVWIYEHLVGRDTTEFTLKEFKINLSKHHFDVENKSMNDDLRRCSVFS